MSSFVYNSQTKPAPGVSDCPDTTALDKPVFTVGADDPLGPEVVRFWLSRYLETKTADSTLSADDMNRCMDKALEAERLAQLMILWKAQNPEEDSEDKPAAISSAELIKRTDTPEIRGAIGPRTRGA